MDEHGIKKNDRRTLGDEYPLTISGHRKRVLLIPSSEGWPAAAYHFFKFQVQPTRVLHKSWFWFVKSSRIFVSRLAKSGVPMSMQHGRDHSPMIPEITGRDRTYIG